MSNNTTESVVDKTTETTEKTEEKQSTLYYFYSVGCGWCKKTEPHIDALIGEGHNILKLDLADSDNQKVANEVKQKYKKQCGTPFLIDADTGNAICGFREKDIIEKLQKDLRVSKNEAIKIF